MLLDYKKAIWRQLFTERYQVINSTPPFPPDGCYLSGAPCQMLASCPTGHLSTLTRPLSDKYNIYIPNIYNKCISRLRDHMYIHQRSTREHQTNINCLAETVAQQKVHCISSGVSNPHCMTCRQTYLCI